MIIELVLVHLLPEVKCQRNCYIIVYLKSVISQEQEKRPLACFRRYDLITLPYVILLTCQLPTIKQQVFKRLKLLCLFVCLRLLKVNKGNKF